VAAILETERVRLRPYTHDDLDDLAAMFADEEHMRFYSHPKSRDESQRWIDWNLDLYQEHGFGLWVMESLDSSEFLGDCGLTPQTVDSVTDIEVGWHTVRSHWNQGLATEAAAACRDLAFDEIGRRRLISIIHPDNIASRRVAEKIGMTVEKTAHHGSGPKVIYAIDRLRVLRSSS
jgi:RimJ/RimL family protein N-acetyltransferase